MFTLRSNGCCNSEHCAPTIDSFDRIRLDMILTYSIALMVFEKRLKKNKTILDFATLYETVIKVIILL
jgi:hypothetical protein